ncbi:hypothetical protein [Wolbachia endosymbiont (group B) of Limnophora tigrina]|uniref:hypothetical protein n=1 Tax=Wolbachia endosymbiont (group B) of Limnophora tigrina TaxID=3139317 RepID=UPI0035B53D81
MPLAIFAVSAIVALISTIYLIRLAVSRAGDKKKIDLSGEESGHTASQEPQKLVHENSTNLESKPIGKEFDKSVKKGSGSQIKVDSGINLENQSSVPTPQSLPVTLETQQIPHAAVPPPPFPQGAAPPPPLPPEGLKDWNLSKNNPTGKKSSVGATKKNTSPRKKYESPEDSRRMPVSDDTITNERATFKKPVEPNSVTLAMLNKFNTMNPHAYSESENECFNQDDEGWSKSEHSGSDISCANEGKQKKKKLTKHREKSTSSNLQSDGEKRSKSPDSGNVSGDDVHSKLTSPLPPEPKAEKPPKPLKPANLQMCIK